MVQAATSVQGTVETTAEMWYLLAPTIGTYNISVPNTNAMELNLNAFSFKSSTGYSAFDNGSSVGGTQTNPQINLTTTSNGDAIIAGLGSGLSSSPTAWSHTTGYVRDTGVEGYATQYTIQTTAGLINMNWTAASDDAAVVIGAFKEAAAPQNHSRNATDGVTVSNSVARTFYANRNVSQAMSISDSIARTLYTNRNISQGVTVSDSVNVTYTNNAVYPGTLTGYINSTLNDPAESAAVWLTHTNGSRIINTTTVANGSYTFENVSVGNYYIFALIPDSSSNRSSTLTITQNGTTWSNLTLIPEYSFSAGQNVSVNLSGSFDYEGDTLTYSCNRTDLFTDFNSTTGKGNWTATSGSPWVKFGVSDGTGYSNKTIIFNITGGNLYTRNVSQGITITDTSERISYFNRAAVQGITVADTVERNVTVAPILYTRNISQGLSISDSVTRIAYFNRGISQNFTIADVVERNVTVAPILYSRNVSDTITVASIVNATYIESTGYGTLTGFINLTANVPIESATVWLTHTNGSRITSATTLVNGSYTFSNVPIGNYYIFALVTDLSSNKSSNFTILDLTTTWSNLTLIPEYVVNNGQTVSVNLSGSFDFEGNPLTYSCNRTDLFTDFSTITGKGNWTTSSANVSWVKFGAADASEYSNKTLIFNVTGGLFYFRNVSQGITIVDIVERNVTTSPAIYYRNVSQEITITDTAERNLTTAPILYSRNISQSLTVTDTAQRKLTANRNAEQNLTIVDTVETNLVYAPNITAWYNSINGWNQTAMSINAGNSATFNVTVNQTVTNVSWKVAGSEEQNMSSLQFTRAFNTLGDYNVTAQAFNENGSSNIVYTVVSVVSGGGGGTNWDYAYGWVKYANGTPISGATVTTSKGSDNSDVNGYFDFGYVFEHGSSYWFNVTKSGFYENDTEITFSSGDYQIVNITLVPIPPAQNAWNVSGYVFNSTGGLIEGSLISYSGGSNLSDVNGYWYISNVTNGTYDFTASKSGHVSNTTSISMNGADLTNQNFTLIEIIGINVTGYVYNELGAPVYQARIDVESEAIYNFTDLTGAYSLQGLNTYTEYTILARAIGYRNNTNTTQFTGDTQVNFTMAERKQGTVSAPGFDGIVFILAVTIIFIKKIRRKVR